MTTSPSDPADSAAPDPLLTFGQEVAEAVGGTAEVAHGRVKVRVQADGWLDALRTARDQLGLGFFSWLSAVEWTNEVEVGDPPAEEVEERFELLCALSDLTEGRLVVFSTDLDENRAEIDSAVEVFAGADWHERETHEMYGIGFRGHQNLVNLYLPDGFLGNPLRKSFPLLTREVKPWPGDVDVEPIPSAEEE